MAAQQISIGKTNLRTMPLGVGAMTWGSPRFLHKIHPARFSYGPAHGIEEERKAVEESLAAGVTLFDTASMYSYGASERRLGEVTEGMDVLIASKFPSSFLWPKAEDFPKTLEKSLERLRRKRIDLYQVHFPTPSLSITKVMDLMADAVQQGKIAAIGVSNYDAHQMHLAHELLAKRGIPLASNQVQYSLLYRKPETDGVLSACRELGITLIAYMPLAMGALTGKYVGGEKPGGIRRFMRVFGGKKRPDLIRLVDLLIQIGSAHGASAAQVALRWLIQQGNVIPIPGAKNGRQAAHNASALSFSLSGSEMQALDEAAKSNG